MSLFLGVDVGWSKGKKTTGVCLLSTGSETATCRAECTTGARLHAVLDAMLRDEGALAAVAIDGPLRPGLEVRRCHRPVDSALSRGAFRGRCNPAAVNTPVGLRLHKTATSVASMFCGEQALFRVARGGARPHVTDENVYEAFPSAFLGVMLPEQFFSRRVRRGRRTDAMWHECAKAQLPRMLRVLGARAWNLSPVANHEKRAALICAITAWAAHSGKCTVLGGQDSGWIVLPPWLLWQKWAKDAIRETAPAAGARLEIRHRASGHA